MLLNLNLKGRRVHVGREPIMEKAYGPDHAISFALYWREGEDVVSHLDNSKDGALSIYMNEDAARGLANALLQAIESRVATITLPKRARERLRASGHSGMDPSGSSPSGR